jgi:hypothetical protein
MNKMFYKSGKIYTFDMGYLGKIEWQPSNKLNLFLLMCGMILLLLSLLGG